jgi:hypothetical protein
MNLLLLPKELQDLINEFNIEHRPLMQVVMHELLMRVVLCELLIKYEERIENDKYCVNCNDYAEEQYTRYIFWDRYTFCGEWCSYDTEYDLRKSCKM